MELEIKERKKSCVCVTGGTGFLASWLLKRLLEDGYSVRTTVRSHPPGPGQGRTKDVSYLTELPNATERLRIFEADLEEPESFEAAIQGCQGVFHVAHPMDPHGTESEEALTTRTVEGLLGILRACSAAKTVKRFVYVSSAVTVFYGKGGGLSSVDESVWSDMEVFRETREKRVRSSYVVSKLGAEMTALEFGEQNPGFDVITLVIPLVVGPFISPFLPSSVFIFLAIILGKSEKYWFDTYNAVHIDDVARAMIHLVECPDARGRYICSSVEMKMEQMVGYLSTKYPQHKLPPIDLEKFKPERNLSLSSKKLLNTGFHFKYGIDDIFSGAIQSCKDRGFL